MFSLALLGMVALASATVYFEECVRARDVIWRFGD